MGKGVSNSVIQPRDVDSVNCEVDGEGKEGDGADEVHHPGGLGIFGAYDGYDGPDCYTTSGYASPNR